MAEVNKKVLKWLLEDDNLPVKYRTMIELIGLSKDNKEVVCTKQKILNTLIQTVDTTWISETKGLWTAYNLTALAECGLDKNDIPIDICANNYLGSVFDSGCGDAMILRALVMLGYENDKRILTKISGFAENQLLDGGFLCLHRLEKMKYIPKSCIKDNMHVLLLYSECRKRGINVSGLDNLIDYFFKRAIFYRSDNHELLVLNCKEGWRTIDTFFPIEVMRVGLPHLVEAFCSLGFGNCKELNEAWRLLESKKDNDGRYKLEGTLAKSYLPKERIGKPSKWVTFYSLLAQKYSNM